MVTLARLTRCTTARILDVPPSTGIAPLGENVIHGPPPHRPRPSPCATISLKRVLSRRALHPLAPSHAPARTPRPASARAPALERLERSRPGFVRLSWCRFPVCLTRSHGTRETLPSTLHCATRSPAGNAGHGLTTATAKR